MVQKLTAFSRLFILVSDQSFMLMIRGLQSVEFFDSFMSLHLLFYKALNRFCD